MAPAVDLGDLDDTGVGTVDATGEREPCSHRLLAGAGDRRRGAQTFLGLDAEGELLLHVRTQQGRRRTVLEVTAPSGHPDRDEGGQGDGARKEVAPPAGDGSGGAAVRYDSGICR